MKLRTGLALKGVYRAYKASVGKVSEFIVLNKVCSIRLKIRKGTGAHCLTANRPDGNKLNCHAISALERLVLLPRFLSSHFIEGTLFS